ncbi:cation/H(+) antiporter 3-like [Corylus avellana]|uniref:cation/H(+) antiporter 3-like n=1 Tax=Corylus avellana TaxID=13451 RepID=UPI001E21F7A8|nr:cation/H(+) antiporter 3-like [Corylus avellana]
MAGEASTVTLTDDYTISYDNASNTMIIQECTGLPSMVHSEGMWRYIRYGVVPYTLPLLQLQMVLIFTFTQASYYILKRYGIPKFTTQLIVGIILGPSLLGRFKIFKNVLFSIQGQEIIGILSVLSFTLFLFVSAVKMDIGMIKRNGRKALFTGVASMLLPLLIGMSFEVKIGRLWLKEEAYELPYITIAHCITSFPVLALLLEDLKILNSELGRLSLSTTMICDMLSLLAVISSFLIRIYQEKGTMFAAIDLGAVIIYIFVLVYAIRPAMFWVIRQTPKGRPIRDAYIHTIMLMILGFSLFSNFFGGSLVVGPFILGLAIPDGPPLGSTIVNKFNCFVSDVFLPLFVTTCAMRTDLRLIKFDNSFMTFNGILIVLIFVAKMLGSLVPPLYAKMPLNDALTLALLVSFKGATQLQFYSFLNDTEVMTDQVFTLSCVSILVIAISVPLLVKFLYHPSRRYAGYQKRDIMHCRANTELRILVCIHRPDSIAAVIKLLEVSCPSRERPLAVYVLHLIELIGRTSPIFISHQVQKKTVSNSSYSENVIHAFNNFEQDNQGVVSVNIFTLISVLQSMHEDICILGLDKLTSLIVLPFHRKWSINGIVESEDSTIRILNCSMLELAPCSIGILVDRGYLGRQTVSSQSLCSVAMFFLGGNDDREALAFANRMANHSKIALTVVHFIASDTEGDTRLEKLFDNEILNHIKLNNVGNEYVIFQEKIVKDGAQTALIVRGMMNEYDLIIVGRRHNVETSQTSGLAEWSEFPELGIMGDLLVSLNLNCTTSVFVVQQQQKKT